MSSSQLILTVSGAQAAQFGASAQKRFAGTGGSIGRSDESDWVLAAPGVSRTHAVVRFLNGMYFIEDRSTNGMSLNGTALTRADPSALSDGDRLQLDSFEIQVQVQALAAASTPAPVFDPLPDAMDDRTQVAPPPSALRAPSVTAGFDLLEFGTPPAARPAVDGSLDDLLLSGTPRELDPLRLLDPLPAPARDASRSAWNQSNAGHDHFRPPASADARATLPENWDMTLGDFAPSAPSPALSPTAAPVASPCTPPAAVPVAAAASAATTVPAELERIFAIVVDGVMDVLRARAEIKNTFRLPVTVIQRSENNPLKFAATAEDALQKLLAPPSASFLSGVPAFEDAFDDIRCHQMAMLADMRAAFDAMLFHFSPDRLEQEADAGGKRLGFGGKGRYWERYRDNFEQLRSDPDECFRRLFGDEFARAYEAQLARLKSARRPPAGRGI
ncbi:MULTISPECIES: type VI secretion system-associated FHA domain protein TagH [Xanthomonas]|uniref:type VI secretion system-associated FHA domain protein TagH n=1 Tax=Xanthomonas TaxID=338 RepID=UPI001AD9C667|nr:type VI secretion system-associated FHA domain protein TagH [Xanthomonas phaseoli pv. dieffenbachiae]MBO9777906.1 type VI secretion system-associated FHA domain protein TagH [Xanthomonas phaseoli pv. dieffenbachiae]MBO9778819.1 type VI secretion system-associated FHA domain protein TagH [Xanthomonas phaseoli pv. dieffenbachiae]MBO9796121.1 type VI secretion system-associated FHA domain protein TagH [Xanthomonas phaseoli pv. dieffenbachiae]MBO9802101.1 type VI secretion system-associated FHA 